MARIITTEQEKRLLSLDQEEVRLKRNVVKLKKEFDDTNVLVSNAKGDLIKIEESGKRLLEDAKVEVKRLTDLAQEKVDKAQVILGQANSKMTEAVELMSKANELIKSNEGREKSLNSGKNNNEAVKIKLLNIVRIIQEALK